MTWKARLLGIADGRVLLDVSFRVGDGEVALMNKASALQFVFDGQLSAMKHDFAAFCKFKEGGTTTPKQLLIGEIAAL